MLRKTYGKMVYELRPSVDWHKGKVLNEMKSNPDPNPNPDPDPDPNHNPNLNPDPDPHQAVEWLMEQFSKNSSEDIFPVYIGDDVTDEDAFAIMGGLGGVGIIVSETARETSARYGLRNPAEVVQFLEHFIGDDRAESTHASSVGDFAPIRPPPPQISRSASAGASSASSAGATTINAREFVS